MAHPRAHDDPPDTLPEPPHPQRWRILGVSLVVGFMSLLDVTIVNVAIPSIQSGLDSTPGTIQWVVSGYALTFGLVLVTGGRLGDAYGRRRLMLIGLTGFTVSSALVGLAPTAELVVAARLLQGASAGLLTPQNSGLIQQLFTGAERARAFGLFGMTVSVSSALGPLIGGAIIGLAGPEQGWRYVFLVNVPIGVVALVAVARMVPKRPPRPPGAPPVHLDLVGALLIGVTVLSLLYPVVELESGARLPLLLLLLVVPAGVAFVRWEARVVRHGGAPLLDVELLRRTPGYGNGIAVGTLYFTGFTGLLLVLSVHLQDQLGLSALAAGALVMPYAVGSAVAAPLAARAVTAVGRRITVWSLVVVVVGVVATGVLAPLVPTVWLWAVLAPCLVVAGLGGGATVSPNLTLSLAEVPPRMGGAAGGALQTGQRIGSAIGAAVLMTTYQVALGSSGLAGTDGWGALRLALAVAVVLLLAALAMAVRSLRTPDPA